MDRLFYGLVIALVVWCGPHSACAQQAPGQQARPQRQATAPSDIFSGNITELRADSLTVVQRVPGREAVTRTFGLDAQTTIEGRLRAKARVTVRYKASEDGAFTAVHIIVRG